jgi:hypothetical protein
MAIKKTYKIITDVDKYPLTWELIKELEELLNDKEEYRP